jgi:protein-S-isoprenylcysteine O-methyltransferase Ste14
MKLLTDWGFAGQAWRGNRGEYWVIAQALLLLGFALLPIYQPPGFRVPFQLLYLTLPTTLILVSTAIVFMVRGLRDLGHSLTPLPYPKADGELVQTGVYGIVRHPLYSGLILAALGWAILQLSWLHLLGAIGLFLFFNAKSTLEETWLIEKHADYTAYSQQVKKLIPWIY